MAVSNVDDDNENGIWGRIRFVLGSWKTELRSIPRPETTNLDAAVSSFRLMATPHPCHSVSPCYEEERQFPPISRHSSLPWRVG